MRLESERQICHIILGLFFILLHLLIGRELLSVLLFLVLIIGIIIINFKLTTKLKIPYIDRLLFRLERPYVTPGLGSFWFVAGIFITALMFIDFAKFMAVVLILSFGDGLATLIGQRFGKHFLPWNKNKTFEGMFGFFIGSLTAFFVYPSIITFFIIIISAFGETYSKYIDDNILVPFIAGTLYFIF